MITEGRIFTDRVSEWYEVERTGDRWHVFRCSGPIVAGIGGHSSHSDALEDAVADAVCRGLEITGVFWR